MARRKGRRKFRRYLKGQIHTQVSLGTLAAKTGLRDAVDDSVLERTWCSSIKCTHAMNTFTPAADAGPIQIYLAHSDYSLAEIEEWIENAASWNAGDLRTQEIARRKIRYIGTFPGPFSNDDVVVLNDGKPVTTKCGWMLITGQTLAFVYYNVGVAALSGTNPDVIAQGHANLWPA